MASCHTADSKPVKQEVNGTVILTPLVFRDLSIGLFEHLVYGLGSWEEPGPLADCNETTFVREWVRLPPAPSLFRCQQWWQDSNLSLLMIGWVFYRWATDAGCQIYTCSFHFTLNYWWVNAWYFLLPCSFTDLEIYHNLPRICRRLNCKQASHLK
jgi:hypothetical protein